MEDVEDREVVLVREREEMRGGGGGDGITSL